MPEQWLRDVEDNLKKNPSLRIFSSASNDGWSSGHCICDNCRKWDHPKGEPRKLHWDGLFVLYAALSDRHVTFANKCAELLKKRFPDKDYHVLTMAYGHSRPVPIEAVPADNVIVSCVANFLGRRDLVDRASTWGTTHRDQFIGWGKVAKKIMWRPNTGSPAGWQQGQLDVSIKNTIEDFKLAGELGCMGIFIDGVWEHWATHAPQYYVMGQLAWDYKKDGDKILADYYSRGFGEAAGDIKAYWDLAEATKEIFTRAKKPYWVIYNKAFFDKASGLLQTAGEKVKNKDKKYQQRIDFINAGLEFTRNIVEVRRLMKGYLAGGKTDKKAAEKVKEHWKIMEQIPKDYPWSINWGPVRPMTPRMIKLHPDHLEKKKKQVKKKKQKEIVQDLDEE
ncbi:MAG: DUF4838 domain-containing protein [Planctomycetota bacterium]|jgi:hypothetical protein